MKISCPSVALFASAFMLDDAGVAAAQPTDAAGVRGMTLRVHDLEKTRTILDKKGLKLRKENDGNDGLTYDLFTYIGTHFITDKASHFRAMSVVVS